MDFAAQFVDRTGVGADQYRKKWRSYIITINPNIRMSQDDPEYEQFKEFFFYKLRLLYRRENMMKVIDHVGKVEWPEVVVVADTSIEYGETSEKLHAHTVFNIAVPWTRFNENKISLSYEKFHALVAEVMPEPEFASINTNIRYVDASGLNITEYLQKKARG